MKLISATFVGMLPFFGAALGPDTSGKRRLPENWCNPDQDDCVAKCIHLLLFGKAGKPPGGDGVPAKGGDVDDFDCVECCKVEPE